MSRRVQNKAGDIDAEQGLVLMDGPGPVVGSFTSAAAHEIGRRLIAAAQQADRQRNPQSEAPKV